MTSTPSKPPFVALASMVIAIVLGVVSWQFLGQAADTGVERLARIDRLRGWCDTLYAGAQDRTDTMRVDRVALPDTVDPESTNRIARCGALRGESVPNTLPNPREMSGEEMPRGLR
ncbi:MAG: hypothetical protein RLZZ621_2544 [Gemmatimonadota bacterium]